MFNDQADQDLALEYSRSVNHTSNVSMSSTITFLPEKWSSTIVVKDKNSKAVEPLPKLSQLVESRIEQLGLRKVRTGEVFQNPRIYKYEKSNSVYQGEVLSKGSDEVPHGIGNLYLSDGSFFTGTFANGFANGPGQLFLTNGSYYEGSFYNNMISGVGKFVEG